jgi:starch-binding outer membrane protein, SusD/RagB family
MRNAHTTRRVSALALSVLLLASCDLVVDPANNVPPEIATENIAGVKSILTSVYARLQGLDMYGNKLMLLPDLMADNARTSQPAVNRTAEYSNAIGAHMGNWGESYQAINEANYAIASARALVEKEPTLANRYLGEALFLRALLYFDLGRVFSYEPGKFVNGFDTGVVLRTEPTRTAGEAVPQERAKVEEIYTQMEKDLQEAITILTQHGQTGPYAANRASAEALLAKVYLYWSKWSNAITQASAALSHTNTRLAEPSEVAGMFAKAPNVESLFEINYDAATETLWVNDCTACYTWPNGTWFAMWPSAELLALFESGDARVALYPTTASGIRYSNKYTYARGSWTDNSPVIRYADVLLMRAEAYAESGQGALALNDLNALRAKRNASALNVTGAALVSAIQDERRRELAFEGSRWFDLKRRGQNITKPAFGSNPTVPYTDFRILAGLPATQVQNNALLKQNPGY